MNVNKRILKNSKDYWERAQKVIMDGTQLYSKGPNVNVYGVSPIYLKRGKGSHCWDIDGNEYIDYSMGVGTLLLGYCYPSVINAIHDQLVDGSNLSLVHPLEVETAERLVQYFPCAEKVRFLKTGSDATSAAIRLARAYTGRDKIIKGFYHGWQDWCMANSKRNAGIPKVLHDHVFYMEYNRLDQAKQFFYENPKEIACVITEPVILEEPENDFLKKLRELCHENGSLLIFDEVVTGFRFSLSGAQGYFGVTPDMAVLGKSMANGMPLSAVVGKTEIFDSVHKKVFISTTFGGETLSLAAACALIDEVASKDVIQHVWRVGERLKKSTNELLEKYNLPVTCMGYPPRLNFSFMGYVNERLLALKTLFLQEITKRGILLGWTMFPSYSHTEADIEKTLEAFEYAFFICQKALREGNILKLLEGPLAETIDVL